MRRVFGVWGVQDAAAMVALGLHALQHRGQEACGIATFDGSKLRHRAAPHGPRRARAFSGPDLVEAPARPRRHRPHPLPATAGGSFLQQRPADVRQTWSPGGGSQQRIAIGHNGNLTNWSSICAHRLMARRGDLPGPPQILEVESSISIEARSRKARTFWIDRFVDALSQIEGGYAPGGPDQQEADRRARDPLGIRPLRCWVRSSSAAKPRRCNMSGDLRPGHDRGRASCCPIIEHGEVVGDLRDRGGILPPVPGALQSRPCLFEYVYFARPDSVVNGRSVYDVRKRMGARLAQETGVEADVVVPVPDSGVPAALGFAQESGLPFELGIIRSHYAGRTFIQPSQGVRELGVRMKHSPNRTVLEGKRVILIDDSIVRGTTSVKIVRMVREAGAAEVHLRSASPPIKFPDFYGIDMPDRDKLLAATKSLGRNGAGCALEVDSLGFLSVEGLYWAMGAGPRDPACTPVHRPLFHRRLSHPAPGPG